MVCNPKVNIRELIERAAVPQTSSNEDDDYSSLASLSLEEALLCWLLSPCPGGLVRGVQ